MLKKLSSASTQAINASGGTFSYVTEDMDGEARSGISDIGADEYYATSSNIRKPLTTADVGPVTP
ncbi:hypothetical protein D3C78_1906300 [compost metagenome]